MLDLDGTLVPFEIDRHRAVPAPDTLTLLQRIAASGATTLAVISGRPLRELSPLLGHPAWTLFAEHGWDRCESNDVVRHALPQGAEARLDKADRLAREAGFADQLERKRASLAVHTRGLEDVRALAIETSATQLWTPLTEGAPLKLCPFRGGIELRVSGRDKGTAVQDLLARESPGTLAVYVGDDRTDEDAFAALPPDGIGVRVGAVGVSSAASVRLRDPEDVARFLARWLAGTGGDSRAPA
jgi:trehalose-phosphatase